jgi:hypothetical protein
MEYLSCCMMTRSLRLNSLGDGLFNGQDANNIRRWHEQKKPRGKHQKKKTLRSLRNRRMGLKYSILPLSHHIITGLPSRQPIHLIRRCGDCGGVPPQS